MKKSLDDRPLDVVTGSSADFWILEPLLWELDRLRVKTRLIVTGTHLYSSPNRGISVFPNYDNVKVVSLEPKSSTLQDKELAVFTDTFESIANFYGESPPSKVIYLGDRLEILAVAELAHLLNIPSFHLHGGEVTLGSQDDSHRHAITKLSKAHVCFSQTSRSRLIQLGESSENIFLSQSLVLDRISKMLAFPIPESRPFGGESFAILTIHPITNNEFETLAVCNAAAAALEKADNLKILITGPNTDKGSAVVEGFVESLSQNQPNKFQRIHHVGGDNFLRMMLQSEFVIGNSSAGILEAPLLGVPTINIGSRQSGRNIERSVIQCEPNTHEIHDAIVKILDSKAGDQRLPPTPPQGVAGKILNFVLKSSPTPIKEFVDA
jgi:GDP/UDP-N,N'-diacetylbacillosamine 2-epimerase (hydrolysing)